MTFKNFDQTDWFNFVGLVFGFIAAMFFYFGSTPMPWSMQTWDGNHAEIAFQNKQDNFASSGFLLLALSFGFQVSALTYKRNNQ